MAYSSGNSRNRKRSIWYEVLLFSSPGCRTAERSAVASSSVPLPDLWCSQGRKTEREAEEVPELFKDELYLWDLVFFAAREDRHTCPWVCEQLPDPCVLYTRNSASTSASMKIRQLWSLLPQTVALVSLCQQNISHAQQQPSILICGALVCNAFKAWNTKIWIKGTFSQGWQERSRIFSMKNMSLCKWLWTGGIIQTGVINTKKWGRDVQGDRKRRDWKLCRQSDIHKVSGVYCRIVS